MKDPNKYTFFVIISVLQIIAAVAGLISGVIMIGNLSFMGFSSTITVVTLILSFAAVFSLLLGGICGLELCRGARTERHCMLWGVVCVLLQVVIDLINTVWGPYFRTAYLAIGLILPLMYLIAFRRVANS